MKYLLLIPLLAGLASCSCSPDTTQSMVSADESKPVASESKPEASEPKPETSEPKPETSEPKPETSEPKPETSESKSEGSGSLELGEKWYQIQNVTIPEGDALRSRPDIDQPPQIQVCIYENGEHIKTSTEKEGWEVDFPRKGNVFGVWIDPDMSYTIEVWDDDILPGQNIFNITGLSGAAFANKIYRVGGEYDTKRNLASLTFKEVPKPE